MWSWAGRLSRALNFTGRIPKCHEGLSNATAHSLEVKSLGRKWPVEVVPKLGNDFRSFPSVSILWFYEVNEPKCAFLKSVIKYLLILKVNSSERSNVANAI